MKDSFDSGPRRGRVMCSGDVVNSGHQRQIVARSLADMNTPRAEGCLRRWPAGNPCRRSGWRTAHRTAEPEQALAQQTLLPLPSRPGLTAPLVSAEGEIDWPCSRLELEFSWIRAQACPGAAMVMSGVGHAVASMAWHRRPPSQAPRLAKTPEISPSRISTRASAMRRYRTVRWGV